MNAAKHEFQPEEVMAFLDGELSPERATALSQHLKDCKECSEVAAGFKNIGQKLSTWMIEPLPAQVETRMTSERIAIEAKIVPRPAVSPSRPRPLFLKWGFGAVGGIIFFFLVLTVLTPNLLRSRMAANESSAVGSLRTLTTAAATYQSTYGHYPLSLRNFGPPENGVPSAVAADLVDANLAGGQKSGYSFFYRRIPMLGSSGREGYTIKADPLNPGSTGVRQFTTDQTGIIRAEPGGILSESFQELKPNENGQSAQSPQFAPMVARTAELTLVVSNLKNAREMMEQILRKQQGYIGQLSLSREGGSTATLSATLRVPADHVDGCLAELKKLGKIADESQAGQEVTRQHADLVARLQNAHNTETRLNNVIGKHAGSVKEILEVEKESSRVRGEIEGMEAEQKSLEHRVDFATIELRISEEYKAQFNNSSPSASTRIHNSLVTGYKNAAETLLGFVLFLAESGPTLLIWLVILLVPAWLLVRRFRRAAAAT